VISSAPPVIALLDDEAQMLTALGRLLRSQGFDVALFQQGESLLAAEKEQEFYCIVMDLHMPGLNGFDVLQALGDRPVHPPVIIITGHDEAGNGERVRALGACAYLLKPVPAAPLLDAIQHSHDVPPPAAVLNKGLISVPSIPA
jgi:FixJ family two-component response regulator